MERINQKKYNIEYVFSVNTIRVMRYFFRRPHLSLSITEIAEDLSVSRSNVYRAVDRMQAFGVVVTIKSGRRKLYRIDGSARLAPLLFEMFSYERYKNIPPKLFNVLTRLVHHFPSTPMILFGSFAHGLQGPYSDVDICAITNSAHEKETMVRVSKSICHEFKCEFHFYRKRDFANIVDFVVLDSLLNGIPLSGYSIVFERLSTLQKFSKMYLLYRLQKCEEYVKKAQRVSGPAKTYFKNLVKVSLGEMRALLRLKTTIPKKKIGKINSTREIQSLHDELAKRGDAIWLI